MSDRTAYRELCRNEPSIPIFSQDWWLDAVCGEADWDVVVLDKGKDIYATLPYHFEKKGNAMNIKMPLLTQTMGPWIRPTLAQKYRTRLGNEMETLGQLIEGLPPFRSFDQFFHHSLTNWLPFYWEGYQQTTRYTYIFPDLTDLEKIFADVDHGVRKYIAKSKEYIDIVDSDDLHRFYEINTAVFTKQDRKVPYSFDFVSRLDEALRQRGKRRLLFALDKNGELHSGLYIVWSGECTYSLMSGIDPKFKDDGSLRLLFWEGIRHASTVTKRWDFEGSMLKPVERNIRKFGPVQMPYLRVSKNITWRGELRKRISAFRSDLRQKSRETVQTETGEDR
jgi:hypothetical protein